MGKNKKKAKKKCCGKYLKKNKHCRKCPVLIQKACKKRTEEKAATKKAKNQKKKEKKKKAAKKKS